MLICPWHRTNRRDGASAARQALPPARRRRRRHENGGVPAPDQAIRGALP